MCRLRPQRGERGFTLVEILAALLVFAVMTLGLIPLLAASIRGSESSRRAAAGKQLATEAMERARGLPFYIDYNTQPKKVDVADLYFPARTPTFAAGVCTGYLATGSTTCTSTGYTATGPSFVTTCPNAANIACPQDMPPNYTLTFEASFVSSSTTTPETYTKATPATTYVYNSSGNDRPTRFLMQLVVTARWLTTGRDPSTYQVSTLISDKRFSGLKVLGEATVDYSVQFQVGYRDLGSTNEVDMTLNGGSASARIETRRASSASATMDAGDISLVDLVLAQDAIEGNENVASGVTGTTPKTGATDTVVSPPDSSVNPAQVARQPVNHPSSAYGEVTGMDITDGNTVSAVTAGGLPSAFADFSTSPSSGEDYWVANKKASTGGNPLNINDPDVWVARVLTRSGQSVSGSTTTSTNALGTQPGTTSTATVSFKEFQLFKSNLIAAVSTTFDGAALAITGPRDSSGLPSGSFTATARCNADNDNTANASAASATYSGTLWYWDDPTQNGTQQGSYKWVDLATGNRGTGFAAGSGTAGTSLSATLESLQSGATILVFDDSGTSKDSTLFGTATTGVLLSDWSGGTSATTTNASNGRVTAARLDEALAFETKPLEGSAEPDTGISASFGAVGCRAEDYR
jgi:prepilin-type N-terminal cleavage/methylation domain-containing protein